MEEERNKKVIREFSKIFKNEHNVDGVAHLFDTKHFIHHFRAPLSPGFEGFKQVDRMMNGAFPDVVVTEEDLIASGDRVVERSSAVATHKAAMMGEKPTNKESGLERDSYLSRAGWKDHGALGRDRSDGALSADWSSATTRLIVPAQSRMKD